MIEEFNYKRFTPDEQGKLNLGEYTEGIGEMYNQVYDDREDDPAQAMLNSLGNYWSAVVIALNNACELVGYGSLIVDEGEAELLTSFVRPADRRKGIYKRLVEIREEIATQQGASIIKVDALDDLQAPYLRRNGYSEIETNFYEKQLV